MIDQRKGSLTGYCLVLVTLAAGVIQTGCAEPARRQSKARQTATSQTAAGTANSDQKAEQLRQTFEKDRSAGNQIRLAEAQTEAADAHVTMARQCRADHRPRDARKELTAALSQMPGHPQAITMAREVDQDIAKADAFVRQAVAARDKKDDATALHCADQVLAIDRTDATARQIVDTARGAAFKSTLQQASEALDKRQWDAAAAAAGKALQIDPANAQAKDIAKKAADRKHALELAETSRAATAKGDDLTAVRTMAEAATLWPDNAELTAERDRVRQTAVDRRIAKGDAECAAGRFPAAFAAYDSAIALAPGDAKIVQHREQASVRRFDFLRERYEKQALAGQWESAWSAAVQLATHAPSDDAQSFQNMARAEDMIRQQITSQLRIIPLPSAGVQPATVLAIARAIGEELQRIKPVHYRLTNLDASAETIAKTPLTLADIGNPAKLKGIDRGFTGADLILFVDVTSREFTVRQAANAQPAALLQAQLELQQAKEGLSRARQLALTDERKWDAEARHALNADETFLPKAAAGAYGLLAQKAAEDYNTALRKLQRTPVGDQQAGQSSSADGDSRPGLQLGVRLRLVQATTGRLLWSDDEIDTKVTDVTAAAPATRPAGGNAELQAAAVRQVSPMLQTKARELLTHRSLVYLDDAQKAKGEEVAKLYTRFLFDVSSDPGPFVVAPALDEIFSKQADGAELEACRKLAAKRLKLKLGSAATLPAPEVAAAPAAPAAPAAGPGQSRAGAPAMAAAQTPRGKQTRKPVAAPPAAAKDSMAQRSAPASPSQQPVVTTTGVVIFDGYLSRKLKQFPKERTLIDGITVLVKDTDTKPLDTDLQITVGKYSGKFKALVPGTRLRIRGQSGQEYRLTILDIEHATHKVHLTMERPSVQPR